MRGSAADQNGSAPARADPRVHQQSRGTYGTPRIHRDLRAAGVRVGRKRVARLLKQAGLRGVSRRTWLVTTARTVWVDTGLVFTSYAPRGKARKVGAGLHPRNVLRTLHAPLEAAKLPRVRFHDLRHSAASLLIEAGVELVEVSLLLGHSELRVTADIYTHLQKQTAVKAARHMDALLAPATMG